MKRLKLRRETVRLLKDVSLHLAQGGLPGTGSPTLCHCTEDPCLPGGTFSCATCQANSNCGCTYD